MDLEHGRGRSAQPPSSYLPGFAVECEGHGFGSSKTTFQNDELLRFQEGLHCRIHVIPMAVLAKWLQSEHHPPDSQKRVQFRWLLLVHGDLRGGMLVSFSHPF